MNQRSFLGQSSNTPQEVGLEGMRNASIHVSVSERTCSCGFCCDALHWVLPVKIVMKTPKLIGVYDGS